MLNDLFKRTPHLVQQSVERMLKQMLKPFKRARTQKISPIPACGGLGIASFCNGMPGRAADRHRSAFGNCNRTVGTVIY